MRESYWHRRLRQLEELLRQLDLVKKDLQEEIREIRRQLGLDNEPPATK